MVIYIGADHRGFKLKAILADFLRGLGYEVVDLGSDHYDENDDYPDFARLVAEKVAESPEENRGILICGSGVGVDIAANKFKGIRSALIFNEKQAFLSRNDDDANVISLAADFLNEVQSRKILEVWIKTDFSREERHKRRLDKIRDLENEKRMVS